jgi:hypothetical protein
MRDKLLQRFEALDLDEEGRHHLLDNIAECRRGAAQGLLEHAFNMFEVTINCDLKTVTLQDVLDPAGHASWPMDEFAALLRENSTTR